jgi:dolichol-phosphate mannosyltransferase
VKLSVVIPCYNEEDTLDRSVRRVLEIQDESTAIEIIIVDDGSTDGSLVTARALESEHPEVKVLARSRNQGKGAALRAGFQSATGDFVAVQDADLEYDPQDLQRMLIPLREGKADVVLGSRFLSVGAHRVLYFWHSLGNYLLTFLSNMFTDLNLTDMETGYKVFRCELIRGIDIEESRFGFEPEIVAKLARLRPRIFEIGISYYGRTYEEGKKVGYRDGLRALFCILKYNSPWAPWLLQFLVYSLAAIPIAVVDLFGFFLFVKSGPGMGLSSAMAFIPAALLGYWIHIRLVFRHGARWGAKGELVLYGLAACMACLADLAALRLLLLWPLHPVISKLFSFLFAWVVFFPALRTFVFQEKASGPWRPQESRSGDS